MSVGTFMDELERQGVTFTLVDALLCVEIPLGTITDEQRQEFVVRRGEVEYLVRLALTPSQPIEEPVVADDRHAQMSLERVA